MMINCYGTRFLKGIFYTKKEKEGKREREGERVLRVSKMYQMV